MVQTRLRSTAEIREEQLRQDPDFRASWERMALARAVALALIGYRVKHRLTQSQLAEKLGVRQPQVARLEMGVHTSSLEILQRLAGALGLRFIVDVAPTGAGAPASALTLPAGVEVVEDATADGSRVLVATGKSGASFRLPDAEQGQSTRSRVGTATGKSDTASARAPRGGSDTERMCYLAPRAGFEPAT